MDLGAVDDLGIVHHAHRKAHQVVFTPTVKAGHLGGFPADQGANGDLAALGDARDDLGGDARIEFAHGEIVQEKERLGPLDGDVVDHHGHQVDPDGVVLVHHEGDLELGAHPVGGAHQNRAFPGWPG